MPDGGSTEIDTDETYQLGLDFTELSKVMDRVAEVAKADGPDRWAPIHFGGLDSAKAAAATTMEVLTSLGNSVGYVTTMMDGIATALTGVAATTQETDETNAKSMNTADGK